MITTRWWPATATGPGVAVDDPQDISETLGDGRLVWVDLVDATPGDLERIAEEFALHPLAMEDAQKHGQRPKLEHYPTHAFLVAYAATLAEVDLFVGPTWVVTVRGCGPDGDPWPVAATAARFERTRRGRGVGELVHVVLDDLVDGWFDATERSEDLLEGLEDRIFATDDARRDERALQADLFAVRRELLSFRRAVAPMRDLLTGLLRGDVTWLDPATLVHLQDVFDHVLRVLDRIDTQRELLGNAVDAHLAVLSNRMNQAMKTMTSWGALLLGATLVAGIYGMNFEHMPELGWRYGYPFALGLMALVTGVGYSLFKRRDWL